MLGLAAGGGDLFPSLTVGGVGEQPARVGAVHAAVDEPGERHGAVLRRNRGRQFTHQVRTHRGHRAAATGWSCQFNWAASWSTRSPNSAPEAEP